ncbi:MAG: hypothetical protein AAFV33_12220, partial [Chloroflexota bacterium]
MLYGFPAVTAPHPQNPAQIPRARTPCSVRIGATAITQEGFPLVDFHIRQAQLDDAAAISELARSRVGVWQRMTGGQVETVTYDALSIYERWLHGGPWMSVETGALQLSH